MLGTATIEIIPINTKTTNNSINEKAFVLINGTRNNSALC